MGDFVVDDALPDPYTVLGLPSPADAAPTAPPPSDADIRRAFRRLALVKHPDKQRGVPAAAAAAEFDALQKAYDALTDAAARAAWDDVLRCVVVVGSARARACVGAGRMRPPLN